MKLHMAGVVVIVMHIAKLRCVLSARSLAHLLACVPHCVRRRIDDEWPRTSIIDMHLEESMRRVRCFDCGGSD